MNRDDYMSGAVDHQTFYQAVADAIGRERVERLVRLIAPIEAIERCLERDTNLNNIPLKRWDALHAPMLQLVREGGSRVMAVSRSARESPLPAGRVCWSLSETVSTLKAAARREAQEVKAAREEGRPV